ncbi:hypothetical protein K503DRAFT_137682 [Rhizopogon vinicolor AM-OR11-026]|uniref:Uncharacterized protein n=1 Tax=Rhizopogon vinicolor AM-OR11-026 TaxID=1314800 RepID=A0A1B7N1Q5_9AGAM|nr:hypothetical protein K503DRAFT_137682 [Rhizopogon vinicolor AM-OR11-026]
MNALFARASLKRSPRTRTRKPSISISSETGCPPSRSSSTATCTSPLHIIPELSENGSEPPSPTKLSISRSHESPRPSPRVTLSAFSFSIDDALLMFNDEPRSPALSASSSTEGSNFSEELPSTPGASDDEDFCELRLPSPRLRPHHIEIRPLCITKTRSIVCADDENVDDIIDNDTKPDNASVELSEETREEDEDEHDFYSRQFQDFISLYSSCLQVSAAPARPESVILSLEDAPKLPAEQPKPRGRSRFSKALPRLPFSVPPSCTLPAVPPVPVSVPMTSIRAKLVIPPMPTYSPPPPPVGRRPPPRMSVPSDIGEPDLFDEEPLPVVEQVWFDDDDESIYSHSSSAPAHPLSPSHPETPIDEVYLPRASTDSDAPRSSLDSHSSCHCSSFSSESTPVSAFSFPPTPIEKSHQLRSRWSSSTLNSINVEPSRTATILSPLRNVFGSKTRRPRPRPLPLTSTPPPRTHGRSPSKTPTSILMPLTRMVFPATPSPPSTPSRHVRRQPSRSSTSSLALSECDSCESGNSSSGLRRKPIPVEMFLRA